MNGPTALLTGLLDEAPPPDALSAAVASSRTHRDAWYGPLVRSLVLPESALATSARQLDGSAELAVTVLVEGGAGSLLALGRRRLPGLRLVAAVAPLRDLDDLAGNASRLAVAATELGDVSVHVGLPLVPGWVRAVEAVEAAGLSAALSATAPPATDPRVAAELAEQLSVLVEADLPFHVSWSGAGDRPGLDTAALLVAVQALVDGAEAADAAQLLRQHDPERLRSAVTGWDEVTAARVRRRLLALTTADPAVTVADLVTLGLVAPPTA